MKIRFVGEMGVAFYWSATNVLNAGLEMAHQNGQYHASVCFTNFRLS
jgi:hypothetical protein